MCGRNQLTTYLLEKKTMTLKLFTFLDGQDACNITQHQPAPFKTLVFLQQLQL